MESESAFGVQNLEQFKTRLDSLCPGLIEELHIQGPEICRGLLLAGGSVLYALGVTDAATDLDFFLYGLHLNAEAAEFKFRALLSAVKRCCLRAIDGPIVRRGDKMLLVTRSPRAISIAWPSKGRQINHFPTVVTANEVGPQRPVQLMLGLHASPLEVLVNFDVDCCAFGYDLAKDSVICTPRAQRAVVHRANLMDTQLRGLRYDDRPAPP